MLCSLLLRFTDCGVSRPSSLSINRYQLFLCVFFSHKTNAMVLNDFIDVNMLVVFDYNCLILAIE